MTHCWPSPTAAVNGRSAGPFALGSPSGKVPDVAVTQRSPFCPLDRPIADETPYLSRHVAPRSSRHRQPVSSVQANPLSLSTRSCIVCHVPRSRHQRKQVEDALRHAESEGFEVQVRHAGHTWGYVVAPSGQRLTVWSTPKDADVSARMIRRFVARNKEA